MLFRSIVVELTVRLGYAVFTYATLAFLGVVGTNITDADWGVDVSQTYTNIVADVWWPTIFPALAIASLVIGVNLITDSIDAEALVAEHIERMQLEISNRIDRLS